MRSRDNFRGSTGLLSNYQRNQGNTGMLTTQTVIVRMDNELINKRSASSGSPVNMAVYVTVFAPAKRLIIAFKGTLSS